MVSKLWGLRLPRKYESFGVWGLFGELGLSNICILIAGWSSDFFFFNLHDLKGSFNFVSKVFSVITNLIFHGIFFVFFFLIYSFFVLYSGNYGLGLPNV